MLEKSKRLNLKKDFKWVASGRKIESLYAKIFIKSGQNINPLVGIAPSKANFKKSSDRNRARRLISKAMETLYGRLEKNINIILLPKPGIIEVKSDLVLSDIEQKLKNENYIS